MLRTATGGPVTQGQGAEGNSGGSESAEVLGKDAGGSVDAGPFALDKDPRRYVQPSKEELRKYVGEDPKWLVKDNWAAYG